MVIDTRNCMVQHPGPTNFKGTSIHEGVLFYGGERIDDFRCGQETAGAAIRRHEARKAEAAKFAAQKADDARKIAELRRIETELAKTKEVVAAKAEFDRLKGEIADAKSQLAARDAKLRKGIKFGQSFNAFKPTTPAA